MSDSVSSDVQLFESEQFGSVRIIRDGDKFLFCSKDVCLALGYKDTVNAVKQHCRGVVKHHLIDSLGRRQEASFIPEGDLYRLVAHSKLPSALDFESWVFDEVLPTIRKTGSYTLKGKIPDDPTLLGLPNFDDPVESALAWVEERRGRERAEMERDVLREEVAEMKPKADYHDNVLNARKLHSSTSIAKDYGVGAPTLHRWLEALGVLWFPKDSSGAKKRGGRWYMAAKYQGKGYMVSRTYMSCGRVVTWSFWTEKGRLFLYGFLKEHGHLTIAERLEAGEDVPRVDIEVSRRPVGEDADVAVLEEQLEMRLEGVGDVSLFQ